MEHRDQTPPPSPETAPAAGAGAGAAQMPRRDLALVAATAGYACCLFALHALMAWRGEASPFLAALLFAPPWLPLLPLLPLAAWALVARRALLPVQCLMAAFYWFVLLAPQTHPPLPAHDNDFIILTLNRGGADKQDLQDWARLHDVSLLALQEAYGQAGEYARLLPGYEVRGVDEFVLASRFPIKDARVLEAATLNRRQPVAARFVVDLRGRPVAVYVVHLPTPRQAFMRLFGKSQHEPDPARYWPNRLDLSRELMGQILREPLPFLLAGDFNAPDRGAAYRVFAGILTDAHRARGRGFGLTFPGKVPSGWPQWLGPWLRLDYVFVGPGWTVADCWAGPSGKSEHRAVMVRLRPERTRLGWPDHETQ